MSRPRKTCSKCGLENAPFGIRKNRKDGLSPYCMMCMQDYRVKSPNKRSWKEINRERRSNPEYREKEKKRAAQLDKERRKVDKNYVQRRLQDHYRYLEKYGLRGRLKIE